jgi:hypothetical protein
MPLTGAGGQFCPQRRQIRLTKQTVPSKPAEYLVETRERVRGGLGAAELIQYRGE